MAGIRVSKLCRLFNVGPKELIAFLSSKGVMVSSNPNFKVPESALELLQQEYGHNANIEAVTTTPIKDSPQEISFAETNKEPAKSLILPDSPFRIGTSGKYKLLIKDVTNCNYYFEYLLSDGEGKEYKAKADTLYPESQLLRCIVNLKGEKGRLIVDNVAICKKQDLATPIPVAKPKPIQSQAPVNKHNSNNKQQQGNQRPVKKQNNYKPPKPRPELPPSSLYLSQINEHVIQQMERNREIKQSILEQKPKVNRFEIRMSLTPQKMKAIYLQLKQERKLTTDKLSVKSNTSRYVIEDLEKGKKFGEYTVARLVYFLLTNRDINQSEYKEKPKELFVDYLVGKVFRFSNITNIPRNKPVDNPKACGLHIYLK